MSYLVISVDLRKAFGCISVAALGQYCTKHPLPPRLQKALMREILRERHMWPWPAEDFKLSSSR